MAKFGKFRAKEDKLVRFVIFMDAIKLQKHKHKELTPFKLELDTDS